LLKKIVVGIILAVGAAVLGLITYSYFGTNSQRDIDPSLIIRAINSSFIDKEEKLNPDKEAPELGYFAPDFTLKDLEGNALQLRSLRGKPILLNFWASWCPPCRAEAPHLQEFHRQYGDKVMVLGINWGEDEETVRKFLKRFGITYTNLLDSKGTTFVKYRLTGLPSSFFLDEAGIIRGVWFGPLTVKEIVVGFKRITGAIKDKDKDEMP